MLERIIGFLNSLTGKRVSRIALALVTVICILAGYLMLNDYQVVVGSNVYYLSSVNNDSMSVLMQAGVVVDENDVIGRSEAGDKTVITVDRVEISEGNEDVSSDNELTDDIQAVLGSLGFDSVGGDYSVQPLNISYEQITVKESVKFSYKTVYSSDLEKGKSKVTKGKNGEKEVVYNCVVVNGVVMERTKVSENITVKPTAQVETIGTRVKYNSANAVMTSDDVKSISTLKPSKPIELDKNGVPVAYSKVITGKASAYCGCCDSNNTAYFGKNSARPGYVAVNPKQIPYGTKLYIVSADGKHVYGYAIAADTGGFAKNGSGRVVDLRLPTGSKCTCGSSWGVKKVNIYVLD